MKKQKQKKDKGGGANLMDQFIENQEARQKQLVKRLAVLLEDLDAEFAFRLLFVQTRFWTEEELDAIVPFIETAARYLYPLFGSNGSRSLTTIEQVGEILLDLVHIDSTLATDDGTDPDNANNKALSAARIYTEFVRGDSFPSQTRRRIVEGQGRFESWFKSNVGVGPLRAVAIIEACADVMADNFNKVIRQPDKNIFPWEAFGETFPASFHAVKILIPDLNQGEWDSLQNLIGLTPGNIGNVKSATDHRGKQVYCLSDGSCLLATWSTVYDALFEAFDSCTRSNQLFRDKKYTRHLSSWTETNTVEYLKRVFPSDAVFGSLYYPDPDIPGGETELDAAVLWGPFLLIVEIKAKQFRDEARLGASKPFVSDFKNNIEDAYKQCLRAVRYIDSVDTATFREAKTGRMLTVVGSKLRVIYPVSVTLRQFGLLQADLSQMKVLGLFGNSKFPWSVTLDDLDVVTKFIGLPDYLIHYIKRRIELQHSTTDVTSDELDLLGSYLDNRLDPSKYWHRTTDHGQTYHALMIGGACQRFEPFYDDSVDPGPVPELVIHPFWQRIVQLLHKRGDESARLCASAILDLTNEELGHAASQVEELVKNLRATGFPLGVPKSITYRRRGITLVFVLWKDRDRLMLEMQNVIKREMYRSRDEKGIAIGIAITDMGVEPPIIRYSECQWVFDEELESLTRKTLPRLLAQAPTQKRNEPCYCNSGKKFKHCCMNALK